MVYNPSTHIIAYSDQSYGLVVFKTEEPEPSLNENNEVEESKQLEGNYQKENQLKNIFENRASKIIAVVGRGAALGASFFGGGSTNSCGSSSYSFIKMFQIIEILGKLIYIPVYFSGELNDILEGVNKLADPIEIPPDLIMKGNLKESHTTFRGKIYENGEYGRILQAMPVSVLIFILLEITILILKILTIREKNQCM